MKLIDLIKDIENIDQEAIIFQENRENPNSGIIISFAEEGEGGIKEEEGEEISLSNRSLFSKRLSRRLAGNFRL